MSSILVLAGWLAAPFCMAGVAYLLEGRSEPQKRPTEGRAASH